MSSHGSQRGSAGLEVVLLTPLFMLVLAFVLGLGRLSAARGEVGAAARDAARAASIARSPASAETAARNAAMEALADHDLTCADPQIAVDTGGFRAGGAVAVELACTVRLDDVVVAGFPGSRVLRATATAPVDAYRGTE